MKFFHEYIQLQIVIKTVCRRIELKKDITSYDDLLDGLRLSLKAYNIK